MKPYYEDSLVTLYHGDARELLKWIEADTCLADPPYGIHYTVSARDWRSEGLDAWKPVAQAKQPPIKGDTVPFDPAPLLRFPRVAIFGANYMRGLPTDGRWIVWDKRRDSAPDDHSDCEMVWTNRPGAHRIHRQKWRGIVREGEENCSRSKKLHTNQKPVALLDFIMAQLAVPAGAVVVDPYMGSGSTGVAAIRRGHPFIGIEIEERYCEIAARRLADELTKLGGAA